MGLLNSSKLFICQPQKNLLYFCAPELVSFVSARLHPFTRRCGANSCNWCPGFTRLPNYRDRACSAGRDSRWTVNRSGHSVLIGTHLPTSSISTIRAVSLLPPRCGPHRRKLTPFRSRVRKLSLARLTRNRLYRTPPFAAYYRSKALCRSHPRLRGYLILGWEGVLTIQNFLSSHALNRM